MGTKLDQGTIMKALDWSYEKAVNGVPGLDTAEEIARNYIGKDGSLHDKVDSLIRWQVTKTATSGFISGLGGLITLPVAIPANITSVLYVQVRMVAAIAYMGGYDIQSDQVKSLVYICLLGNTGREIIKEIGIQLGTKLTMSTIKRVVTREVTKKINQAVGFRLITKFGSTGVINLGKSVPLVGGLVGGSIDGISTKGIGKIAKKQFIYN
jgi:hypothetical protein